MPNTYFKIKFKKLKISNPVYIFINSTLTYILELTWVIESPIIV